MYKVIFLTDAIYEIETAGKWYAEYKEDLDKKFIESVLTTVEKLQSDKVIYAAAYRKLSRIFVKRFPYVIYFRKNTDSRQIIIFGVLHVKQSRANLHKRI